MQKLTTHTTLQTQTCSMVAHKKYCIALCFHLASYICRLSFRQLYHLQSSEILMAGPTKLRLQTASEWLNTTRTTTHVCTHTHTYLEDSWRLQGKRQRWEDRRRGALVFCSRVQKDSGVGGYEEFRTWMIIPARGTEMCVWAETREESWADSRKVSCMSPDWLDVFLFRFTCESYAVRFTFSLWGNKCVVSSAAVRQARQLWLSRFKSEFLPR